MSEAASSQDATAALEKQLASLSYLLTRSQAHDLQASRAGVTAARSDIYLLMALDLSGGVSRVGDLAVRLMVEPSHVTRQIARLESQQLVERAPDPVDRRARRVAITDEGKTVLGRFREANQASLREALQGIDATDVAATVTVLHRLVERYARQVRTQVLAQSDARGAGVPGPGER
jgi:DNA-binding MarR family transcriptional regulator